MYSVRAFACELLNPLTALELCQGWFRTVRSYVSRGVVLIIEKKGGPNSFHLKPLAKKPFHPKPLAKKKQKIAERTGPNTETRHKVDVCRPRGHATVDLIHVPVASPPFGLILQRGSRPPCVPAHHRAAHHHERGVSFGRSSIQTPRPLRVGAVRVGGPSTQGPLLSARHAGQSDAILFGEPNDRPLLNLPWFAKRRRDAAYV